MKNLAIAALLCASVMTAAPAEAAVFRLDWSGYVNRIIEYNTYTSIGENTEFKGSMMFDTSAFSTLTSASGYGLYEGSLSNYSYSVGSFDTSSGSNIRNGGMTIALSNGFPESMTITAYRSLLGAPNDITGDIDERVSLTIEDYRSPFLIGSDIDQPYDLMDLSKRASARLAWTHLGMQTSIADVKVTSAKFTLMDVSAVPEPSSWALMMVGMAATAYAMRRRRATFVLA